MINIDKVNIHLDSLINELNGTKNILQVEMEKRKVSDCFLRTIIKIYSQEIQEKLIYQIKQHLKENENN